MKLFPFKSLKKTRAQAMVEFMLALPLLLVLIYGTIEVARLIFIFSSVANASRQAARYGSTTGEVDNVAYYQNCEGIREVASESEYLIPFDEINNFWGEYEKTGVDHPVTTMWLFVETGDH